MQNCRSRTNLKMSQKLHAVHLRAENNLILNYYAFLIKPTFSEMCVAKRKLSRVTYYHAHSLNIAKQKHIKGKWCLQQATIAKSNIRSAFYLRRNSERNTYPWQDRKSSSNSCETSLESFRKQKMVTNISTTSNGESSCTLCTFSTQSATQPLPAKRQTWKAIFRTGP